MAPSYHEDTSSVKSGGTNSSFTRFFQRNSSSKKLVANSTSPAPANIYTHHPRSDSLSSSRPVSPPVHHHGRHPSNDHVPRGGALGTLSEELTNYQQYQHQLQQTQPPPPPQEVDLKYPTPELEDYRQCMLWLQQTSRPMFSKDLTEQINVPVPITVANAKRHEQIGGTQDVQVAKLKNVQVQVMPLERWGKPQEVLAEVCSLSAQAGHSVPPPTHTHTHPHTTHFTHIHAHMHPYPHSYRHMQGWSNWWYFMKRWRMSRNIQFTFDHTLFLQCLTHIPP